MSIRIINAPTGILFSFAVRDIMISADCEFVDVKLKSADTSLLLSERYYTHNDSVTIYDIDSLTEDYMRSCNKSFGSFTLTASHTDSAGKTQSASTTFSLLFCDRFSVCEDVAAFAAENFLTSLQVRRLPVGFVHSLFFFANKDESLDYRIIVNYSLAEADSDNNSSHRRHEIAFNSGRTASGFGIQELDFSYSQLRESISKESGLPETSIRIRILTVICGNRCFNAVIDGSLSPDDTFYFRNCYNVFDIVALPISTTAKTEVERSLASINGRSRLYNQTTTKSFESELSPLSVAEAELVEQLCSAKTAYRAVPNPADADNPKILQEILITESTCEVSDGHDELNSVKFTWRYADNRPLIHLPIPEGIFTAPFNFNFQQHNLVPLNSSLVPFKLWQNQST